jgi:protein-disulfide isomerase
MKFLSRQAILSVILSALVLMGGTLVSCSKPVQADNQTTSNQTTSQTTATSIDPKLEQQILEVIRKHPEVILESVDKYQQQEQEKQAKAREEAIKKIASNPKAIVGNSPSLGQGKTILIEFSDFQCPFCARARENVKAFLDKRGKDVTFVYKHLPLSQIHPEATPAAKASWAAQQQGKFWPFHDALFINQTQLGDSFYQETAKKLGLDLVKFNKDRSSQAAETAIKQDRELASKLQLNGTPAFIMNGELFTGAVPVEEFEKRMK